MVDKNNVCPQSCKTLACRQKLINNIKISVRVVWLYVIFVPQVSKHKPEHKFPIKLTKILSLLPFPRLWPREEKYWYLSPFLLLIRVYFSPSITDYLFKKKSKFVNVSKILQLLWNFYFFYFFFSFLISTIL